MSAKVIVFFCAQALFIQIAFSQCIGRGAIAAPALVAPGCAGNFWAGNGLIADGFISNGLIADGFIGNGLVGNCAGMGLTALDIIPTSGGGLPVSSFSAISPTGLSITSENAYEGALSVAGELPFVSAVALEGVVPSAGAGAVSYSCGNGVTAIESITPSAAAISAIDGFGISHGLGATHGHGIAHELVAPAMAPATLAVGRGCGCARY